ncbi:hypothetical protein M0R45_017604 [Rubus argutus]|uniref:Coenzyme PQQ synthesis protein F-like C-terminal lobe domain-containing protein n=1 Tax=Rubus argutus TaxID=59490 RepID=A0AAW1XWJ9_RUBAR
MAHCIFSSDDIVIKSSNDGQRLYRLLQLENGLTSLLVHDTDIYPKEHPNTLKKKKQKAEELNWKIRICETLPRQPSSPSYLHLTFRRASAASVLCSICPCFITATSISPVQFNKPPHGLITSTRRHQFPGLEPVLSSPAQSTAATSYPKTTNGFLRASTADEPSKLELSLSAFISPLYYQIERVVHSDSTRLKVLIDLLYDIVKGPLYDNLRTKEQLGYAVECGPEPSCGVLGFRLCVQSSEYNPSYLQGRLDNFINGLEELLEGLDDDSFENYKGGLMAYLLRKDQSLAQESYRLWRESLAKSYTFDYSTKAAEELTSIQKEDVIDFYKTYLQESPKRRRLAVRVWGCNTNFKEAEEACMTQVSGSL